MHPVESFLYYTAMLVPLAAAALLGLPPAHPIVFLYCKTDLTFAALIGHDGYGWPGAASQAHWLHHHVRRAARGRPARAPARAAA